MRFLLGLVIGVLIGGGAVYLALERPWETAGAAVEVSDAGVEVVSEGKKGKRGKGKRRAARRAAGDGVPTLTAADRKMRWKGESVKLPPKTLDLGTDGLGSDGDGRALSPGEINQVVQGQSSSILACIAKSRGNALLEATVIVKMLIGPDGRAEKTRVRAPAYLFAHGFHPCARSAARGLRFPATGGHTVVEVPFELY